MIHFDAHTDLYDGYFGGTPYNHGTPFRRAIEDGYLDGSRVVQIGLRGTRYDLDDIEFGRKHGVTMIMIEELMDRGHADVMAQARDIVGDRKPMSPSISTSSIPPLRRERGHRKSAGLTR